MADQTIVALALLGVVCVLMTVALIKAGVAGAVRMWNVMGALTGVGVGAITTYYFTDKIRNLELAASRADDTQLTDELLDADKLATIERLVSTIRSTPASPSETEQNKLALAVTNATDAIKQIKQKPVRFTARQYSVTPLKPPLDAYAVYVGDVGKTSLQQCIVFSLTSDQNWSAEDVVTYDKIKNEIHSRDIVRDEALAVAASWKIPLAGRNYVMTAKPYWSAFGADYGDIKIAPE